MNYWKTYFGDWFISKNFYAAVGLCASLFVMAFFMRQLQWIAYAAFLIFIALSLAEYFVLFFNNKVFEVNRVLPVRLSNGEDNRITWHIPNEFNFPVTVTLVDEWPMQLQMRRHHVQLRLGPRQQVKAMHALKPVERGEYMFGDIHLFVQTPLKFFNRRFTTEARALVKCYPAFSRLSQYALNSSAIINGFTGSKRMRKIGQSMEFEQIKEYITGDDIRTLNWKATARRGGLMVNQFAEERAQQVYCIIDKGRLMNMPIDAMALLDYAINSTLILSSVCLQKRDKAGLITFSNTIDSVIAAETRPTQLQHIMEALYRQQTEFLESDFEKLYSTVRSKVKNRSLLILFTNFESLTGLHRHLDYFRSLAKYHLLLVVFFENTELKSLIKIPARKLEEVYIKTIAEKYAFEKKQIVRELSNYGIASILTSPDKLTVKTVNKYLELKFRQAL